MMILSTNKGISRYFEVCDISLADNYEIKMLKENSLDHPAIKEAVETCLSRPAFVEFDTKKMTGKYLRLPDRGELNQEVNETLIVEYYNR